MGSNMESKPAEELAYQSAIDLAGLIKNKTLSSLELTEYFIERIHRHDKGINAVVLRDFDRALAAAKDADALQAKGQSMGALHGLPITVKEAFDVAGLATTIGDPQATVHIAQEDAVVVARFKQAGAIILGKTNLPIHAADFQTYNEIYGQTNNPWDITRSPGGSSGGSAAAVAAGLSALELGSDLGGSIRNPAHYCGIYSHKPTWGVVPFRSQTYAGAPSVAQELDMAVPGPLARSAGDLALALELLSGPDVLTLTGWKLDLPKAKISSLKGLRVAIWPSEGRAPVATEISERLENLGSKLSRLGAVVSDTARPEFDVTDMWETYRALVMALTGAPGVDIDYQKWLQLHLKRGQFRMQWQAFFRDWDVLLCPTTSTMAVLHDHSEAMARTLQVNEETRSYWEHVFWAGLATLCYLPSTVFPSGLSAQGLPIGLQAIGAEFNDYTCIEFTRLLAKEIGGFQAPGGYI